MVNKKILLLAHCGEDFYKARVPFAKFLIKSGYQVEVIVPKDNYTDAIRKEGLKVYNTSLERDNLNPGKLVSTIFQVRRYARQNNIGLIHSFKLIPNLINVISNLFSSRRVIMHIAGLGIAFANDTIRYRVIRNILRLLFFFQFLRADLVIIQNPDDFNDFFFKHFFRKKIRVVKGSGVDTEKFKPRLKPETPGRKTQFLCTTRLIWEKGISELAKAFDALPAGLKAHTELLIIGEPDVRNPRAVTKDFIHQYEGSTVVKFLGKKENISGYLDQADVFILPSYYREGIPRSILEALSCGLPVITTDVPGCNLTVKDGENGLLIKPRSVASITAGVTEMLERKSEWEKMGEASRRLAADEFSEDVVFGQIVRLYDL